MPPRSPAAGFPRAPADGWPGWFAPAAFVTAFGATAVVAAMLAGVSGLLGAGAESSVVTVVATLAQDLLLVGTAVAFARAVGRPRLGDFGLCPIRLGRAIGWVAAGAAAFYVLSGVYGAVVSPQGSQDVLESLGAERSDALLLATALLVIVVAPVCEEVFFRGFFYRALRNRFSATTAGVIVALVFGALHYSGPDTLLLLPVLALLGFIFCVLYERSGSLIPAIGLHAVNNAVAFGADADGGLPVAVAFGAISLLGCAVASRLLPVGPAPTGGVA